MGWKDRRSIAEGWEDGEHACVVGFYRDARKTSPGRSESRKVVVGYHRWAERVFGTGVLEAKPLYRGVGLMEMGR